MKRRCVYLDTHRYKGGNRYGVQPPYCGTRPRLHCDGSTLIGLVSNESEIVMVTAKTTKTSQPKTGEKNHPPKEELTENITAGAASTTFIIYMLPMAIVPETNRR